MHNMDFCQISSPEVPTAERRSQAFKFSVFKIIWNAWHTSPTHPSIGSEYQLYTYKSDDKELYI